MTQEGRGQMTVVEGDAGSYRTSIVVMLLPDAVKDHFARASTSEYPPQAISGAWAPLTLLLVGHRLFGTKPLLQQVDNVFCKTGSREREHKRNIYVVAELRQQEAKKTQLLVFQQWPIRPKSYIVGGIWALFGQTRLQCVDDLKVYIFSQGRPFLLGIWLSGMALYSCLMLN